MSAIFGCLDPSLSGEGGVALVERINRANGHASGEVRCVHLRGGMLAAVSGIVPAAVAEQAGRAAAVLGHPRWVDPSFATAAARHNAAAAVLAAYERFGENLLLQMTGACSIALMDAERGLVMLAVDRMGIRTMCYGELPHGIAFGTTVDHVVSHPAVASQLNRQAVFDYFYRESVPSPETIFGGVQKLLPAQRARFRDGRTSLDFYWRLQYAAGRDTQPAGELERELLRVLRSATARAVDGVPDERIGAFLSGGTDSSTLAGILAERTDRPPDTYSIGFEAEGFDEMSYARTAARHFGCQAHEYYVTPEDVAEVVPLIARAYDEPFGNASAVPTFCCARMARGDGKALMIAGDGGDEIFGGNARYAKQKIFEWYGLVPAPVRRSILDPLAERVTQDQSLDPLRKLRSYIRQAGLPLPERLDAYSLVAREGAAMVFDAEFLRDIDIERPAELAREAYNRATSRSPVDRMMHLDLKQTLADNDLRKVNRMCEVAGLEVRYPMLDQEVVEFSGRLAPSQKVRGLRLRHLFKHALHDFLPPETIAKTKHGFGLPFGLWMRAHPRLRELALDSLRDFSRRRWMRGDFIERLIEAHAGDHATYYGVTIWMVIMLEHWLTTRGR